jgi:hypothetical protein
MIEFAPISPMLTYEEAVIYCTFLDYNGYRDWRMPTKEEYSNPYVTHGWYVKKNQFKPIDKFLVTPVRDI